ncbi:hypothetical protein HD554DRAFT_2055235 [Boletus coccyginus]|nr:hypothetical protein HD554DRAFT_2055235 [Boletus coccyginus]
MTTSAMTLNHLTRMSLLPAYTSFLAKYLNPAYLRLRTLKTVMAKFVNESNLQLQSFLVNELAAAVEGLGGADVNHGLDGAYKVPSHGLGAPPSVASAWTVKGSPHKWHYCTLSQEHDANVSSSSSTTARAKAEDILRELQDAFFLHCVPCLVDYCYQADPVELCGRSGVV